MMQEATTGREVAEKREEEAGKKGSGEEKKEEAAKKSYADQRMETAAKANNARKQGDEASKKRHERNTKSLHQHAESVAKAKTNAFRSKAAMEAQAKFEEMRNKTRKIAGCSIAHHETRLSHGKMATTITTNTTTTQKTTAATTT